MLQHVTHDLIDSLFKQAEVSERRRAFHNFHAEDDMLNRLLIVGTTGSYAAPHRHANKLEAFSPVEGGVIVVEFADDGKLVSAFDLRRVPYVEVRPDRQRVRPLGPQGRHPGCRRVCKAIG